MISQILTGAVGGLAYSLAGLTNKGKREKFRLGKMIPTIIVAAIVGGLAGLTGQDYGLVAAGSMAAGVTVIVEKVFKAIHKAI